MLQFRIKNTLSKETFCFLEKGLPSIFKFCALSNLLLFNELLIGSQPTFYLECIVIFLQFNSSTLSKKPWLQLSHCNSMGLTALKDPWGGGGTPRNS